jgi:ketosteroid isomerase-like protein
MTLTLCHALLQVSAPTNDARIEAVLTAAYRAFNARDVDGAVALMSPEVDWPNAWEGGRVQGRDAVREYWRRQFEAVSSEVRPEGFEHLSDGETSVLVRQVVHDVESGEQISEGTVRHRYRVEGGLIVRMDVEEEPGGD